MEENTRATVEGTSACSYWKYQTKRATFPFEKPYTFCKKTTAYITGACENDGAYLQAMLFDSAAATSNN